MTWAFSGVFGVGEGFPLELFTEIICHYFTFYNNNVSASGIECTCVLLYSLCMKFQAELVNFQDQLENRVLCKTFSSRQNSEVHPSVTTHEELKNVFE